MTPDASRAPLLSVVIVRFAGGDALSSALAALVRQANAPPFEVIVVEEEGGSAVEIPPTIAPVTQTVRAPRGSGPARLRTLGVVASRAAIVATTEDHIVVAPDWCAAIVAAHGRHAAPAIGGTIAPAPTLRGDDLAFYLLTYARYLPPRETATVDYLSDCNVSYKREALDRVAGSWRDEFVETVVHAALGAGGPSLTLDATIRVTQQRRVDLRALRAEQREHGEVFARARVARAPLAVRLALSVASLALPPVLAVRSLLRGLAGGCPPSAVLSALPALVALASAWSAGERRGYLSSGT